MICKVWRVTDFYEKSSGYTGWAPSKVNVSTTSNEGKEKVVNIFKIIIWCV